MSSRISAVDISPVRDSATFTTLSDLLNFVDHHHVPEEITFIHTNTLSQSNSSMNQEINKEQVQSNLSPFLLSFSNLTYGVKGCRTWNKLAGPINGDKILLNNISGDAKEGQILALLGPSGSGKSTLLDSLAGRISKGSLKGTVKLNGEKLGPSLLKSMSAYVMQDDILYPMLTVEETLFFAAKFRLPEAFTDLQRKKRVESLIGQLGLNEAAKTVIGDEGHRGVSGGERRRVSIGIGIIHDPILLLLDEPTSGLDSTSAYMVVKVLKRIAQGGSVVVMSVHQPSYRILGLIDRILALSHGCSVYSGSPVNLPLFMEDFGLPVPDDANPVEYALDIVRELEGSLDGTRGLVEFNKNWKSPRHMNETLAFESSIKEALTTNISRDNLVKSVNESTTATLSFPNPLWTEVAILVKRSFLNLRRMPKQLQVRLGVVILSGVVLATLFWQLDDTRKGTEEMLAFFAFTLCITYYACGDSAPAFLHERNIFMRETAHNTYRRSSYVISNSLAIIPLLLLQSSFFAAITFWSVGLNGGFSGFSFYFLLIFASLWSGTSFVTFVSGAVPHLHLCYIFVIGTVSYFLLACGFYISRPRIQPYWKWLHYLSVLKYSYESMMMNEFGDLNRCYVKGVEVFDNTIISDLPLDEKESLLMGMARVLGIKLTSSTCVITSKDLLKNLGITELSKWNCVWVILGWGLFFRVMFYLTLLVGSKNKRS